ncbi:uncharacterized protein LOC131944336 [Physella acuta]|uniref:uncharacterized protein LOC131944336 n=1 Tax=Physella acuta TaxID=109671 RepID=UPI0027DB71F3|nr:uncharacterized protein LOC131944336 [Physella acuta]
MAFFTKLTHDDMSNSRQADEIMFTFYKRMKEKGYLDNTVLITFSDHGPRMGVIRATLNGMVESRSPYSIITFPKWFLDKYSNVKKNLKTNTKRLTTHYDVHATLQDLLYFKASGIVPLTPRKHGTSLFNVIPESRTCEDIPIPMEFCLCNQVKMVELALNSNIAHGFSEIFVKKINSKTNPTLCAELKLDKILTIVQVTLPYNLPRDIILYKIKLQTLPGEGIFEGTIQTPKANSTTIGKYIDEFISKGESSNLIVGEDFDRLSLYRGQADCESDFAKKQYCYCKDLITT